MVGKFLPANWLGWEISRIFQEIQVRRRQIDKVVIFKWAQVATWRDVSLNFGVYQLCHTPGDLDLRKIAFFSILVKFDAILR